MSHTEETITEDDSTDEITQESDNFCYDDQGTPIPLAPGKSFFQIVPASDPRLFVES